MKDLVRTNRSYRRFHQEVSIDTETLRGLVDLARLSASGANKQPLKFMLSNDPDRNAVIFRRLAWAAYLKDWQGPALGERPSAYILILLDTEIKKSAGCDHGIAAQSMLLGAASLGLGGCMVGSIDRKKLSKDLRIPSQYEILLAVALGKPKEEVVIEKVGDDGDIRYWRDRDGVHHVPKRSLDDIIIG